jgi:RHS repeat-associated protein
VTEPVCLTSSGGGGGKAQSMKVSCCESLASHAGSELPGDNRPRVSFVAVWVDGIHRTVASANYGAASSFTRPDVPPASSATVLVDQTGYDDAGRAYQSTDPMGIVNQTGFDNANRTTQTIEDVASLARTTNFTWTLDNLPASMTAVNSTTGDQTTWWIYGTTLADSGVARNDLLRCTACPGAVLSWATLDSNAWSNLTVDQWANLPVGPDDEQITQNTYNRLSELATFTDKRATVRTFTRDVLGRLTDDGVTTVGSDTDATVLRISRTFEVRGMVSTITSADTATPGAGTILNQVALGYNDFSQLVTDQQEHGGAVSGSTPSVGYVYDSGVSSSNEIRLNQLTYPNGRTIAYSFGISGGMSDYLNRVDAINDTTSGTTTLAQYVYLGASMVIRISYPEPSVWLDLWGGTSGVFNGVDQFNRIIDQRWQNDITGTSADIDRYKYGHDLNSNRIWKANVVGTAAVTAGLDEFYALDPLNRLTDMQRGVLNGTNTGITGTPSVEQDWTLDPAGNWSAFVTNAAGTTTLDQVRTANTVNEITNITTSTGPAWVVPAYDDAGNATTMPQIADPTQSFTAPYDAWNRMVGINAGTTPIGKYQYDGRHFRIMKLTYASGVLSETRHLYFTANWQDIEERVGTSTSMDKQCVWGIRYIDELICRDDSTPQRLYALQDANFNLTGIAGTTGDIAERYVFDPYGTRTIMNASWGVVTASAYSWTIGFQGLAIDAECGLIWARTRFLHAELGRWVQWDDGYRDNSNLYLAFLANPIVLVDPLGTDSGIPGLTVPAPQLSVTACCNGVSYDPTTQCCENGAVVAKVRLAIVIRDTLPGDHVDTILANGNIVGWFGKGAEGVGNLKQLWHWDDPDVFTFAKYSKFRPSYVSIAAAKKAKLKSKWCTFPVCPSQATAVANAWKALAKGAPNNFGFVSNNCVNETCKNLQKGNIPVSAGRIIKTADSLLDSLNAAYGSQLQCQQGYFGYVGGSPAIAP